jgi:hypothetical protein
MTCGCDLLAELGSTDATDTARFGAGQGWLMGSVVRQRGSERAALNALHLCPGF